MLKYYKVVLIGDSNVGKTSIRRRYFGENFKDDYMITLGLDLAVKEFDNFKVQIWDIAGHFGFRHVVRDYYRGTHGILVVCAVDDRNSINNIKTWLNEAKDLLGNPIPVPVVVLANKIDLLEKKSYPNNHIKDVLTSVKHLTRGTPKLLYTSALTGENIDQAFTEIVDEIVQI